jgi:hypothetical protein
MRTPRKGRGGSKKERDTGPTDRSDKEAGSEHHQAGQPKVTSYLLDMDLRAVKAHLRHVLRKFRARKKGK